MAVNGLNTVLQTTDLTSTTKEISLLEEPRSGYDLPIYGLDNGTFYAIHIPAIVCIVASFVCATIAIVLSFRRKSAKTFFTAWSKSEKFVVYLAICDGLFNVCHLIDHLHVVIVKNMVKPKELCEFYGSTLIVFISAQNLIVNVVAVNAFVLLYFNRSINFGHKDWKFLLWSFGVPVIGAAGCWATGQLGPNGTFCYFDDVKGKDVKIFFTSAPLILVFVVNIVLYLITWRKLYAQSKERQDRSLGNKPRRKRSAIQRAARAMSLFVIAFFIQWCPAALYGAWLLFDNNVPQPIVHLITVFTNLGGVLNLGILLILRKQRLLREDQSQTNGTMVE